MASTFMVSSIGLVLACVSWVAPTRAGSVEPAGWQHAADAWSQYVTPHTSRTGWPGLEHLAFPESLFPEQPVVTAESSGAVEVPEAAGTEQAPQPEEHEPEIMPGEEHHLELTELPDTRPVPGVVPVPAAAWLFLSGLAGLGLGGYTRRRRLHGE